MTIDLPDASNEPGSATDSDPFSALLDVSVASFDPLVSSSFFVQPKTAIVSPSHKYLLEDMDMNQVVELELVEVSRYPNIQSGTGTQGREPFSLLFRGAPQQPLISAIYTVSHPDTADLNLFLSPVQISQKGTPGESPEDLFYEIYFN